MFKIVLCRMKPAFYCSDRNAQLFCDFSLRQLFPEKEIKNLLIPVLEQAEGIPNRIYLRNTMSAVQPFLLCQLFDRQLGLTGFPAEIVAAFVSGYADKPGFKRSPVFQLRKLQISRKENFLQHVICVRAATDPEFHKAFDGYPLGLQQFFKIVRIITSSLL